MSMLLKPLDIRIPVSTVRAELRRLRSEFILSSLLLFTSSAGGYYAAGQSLGSGISSSGAGATESTSIFPELAVMPLAINNIGVFATLVLGGLLFAAPTVLILLNTGFVTGFVAGIAAHQGLTVVEFAVLIAPHGILEFPMYLLAASIGFKITRQIIQYLRGKRDRIITEQTRSAYFWIIGVGSVITLVSVVIEVHVTPVVYNMFY